MIAMNPKPIDTCEYRMTHHWARVIIIIIIVIIIFFFSFSSYYHKCIVMFSMYGVNYCIREHSDLIFWIWCYPTLPLIYNL